MHNPPLCLVIRRHFNADSVTGQDFDVMKPHAAGKMGKDFPTIGKFNFKERAWQCLKHLSFYNNIILLHKESAMYMVAKEQRSCQLPPCNFDFGSKSKKASMVIVPRSPFPRSRTATV